MLPLKKEIPEKINFTENFNNKFLCFRFIIISSKPDYQEGANYQLKLRDQHFCYINLQRKQLLSLEAILNAGLHFLDMNMDEKEYIEYICTKFKKQNEFLSGTPIYLNVYYFKKISQLNLFEENEHFNQSN